MPKNKITDQEIAFVHLVLSGVMTDRQAAEAVGLKPDSAADTKSKPHVREYMLQQCASVRQQFVQQELDGQHRVNLDREQVLNRLWEIANLSPEITRGSVAGQVKALSMIVAMQNFIPDRRATDRLAISSETKSTPAPAQKIHTSAWLRRHPATTPATTNDPDPGSSQSTFAKPLSPMKATQPYVPLYGSVPDLGVPFPIKNPFVHNQ